MKKKVDQWKNLKSRLMEKLTCEGYDYIKMEALIFGMVRYLSGHPLCRERVPNFYCCDECFLLPMHPPPKSSSLKRVLLTHLKNVGLRVWKQRTSPKDTNKE